MSVPRICENALDEMMACVEERAFQEYLWQENRIAKKTCAKRRSEMRAKSWKSKYLRWYRLLESVLEEDVPHLTDEDIMEYVSNEDWIIIPIAGEEDKEKAKQAQRPNLYFDLSEEKKIHIGITYDKLDSVKRLRNILSPFNEKERNQIIEELIALEDSFLTKVYRKIKERYWAESPTYKEAFIEHSNKMDYHRFIDLFDVVDKIMNERSLLDERKKYQLAPTINIVCAEVRRDEDNFREVLSKIKSIYEITTKVRTKEEIEEEISVQREVKTKKNQRAFAKYVEELTEKRRKNAISAEEYRRLVMEYQKRRKN